MRLGDFIRLLIVSYMILEGYFVALTSISVIPSQAGERAGRYGSKSASSPLVPVSTSRSLSPSTMARTRALLMWSFSIGSSSPFVLSLTKFYMLTRFTFIIIVLLFVFTFKTQIHVVDLVDLVENGFEGHEPGAVVDHEGATGGVLVRTGLEATPNLHVHIWYLSWS